MLDVNMLGLREVQLKDLEGRLIYANGTIMAIEFMDMDEREEFLSIIHEYTTDLNNVFENVN